ncbi:uncharacterized protein J3R85_018867 [Psidium guajava]|nr:uncharacterized protein J3R85_018867 [Psidium guajava]
MWISNSSILQDTIYRTTLISVTSTAKNDEKHFELKFQFPMSEAKPACSLETSIDPMNR